MIVLESNQNNAAIKDTEVCPTLSASMGMGGGYVPMIVVGVDLYNCTTTGSVSKTLLSIRSDADHIPVVMIKRDDNTE